MAEVRQGWRYSGSEGAHIRRIDLRQFRNFSEFHQDFPASDILLTGANGVGKTNLLEAISLLSPGRGLRSAKLSELVNFASSEGGFGVGFGLSGESCGEDLRLSVSGGGSGVGGRKRVKLDGDEVRVSGDVSDYVRVVWLLPQMERVFFDGPSARRRLVDNFTEAFDASHRKRCIDYDNLVRQRNRLLKEGGDVAWLSALESRMAGLGVAIVVARFELIRRLNRMSGDGDGRFPYAFLRLGGLLEDWVSTDSALVAEDLLRARLSDNRERDRLSGVSSVGPNCSELLVYLCFRGDGGAGGAGGDGVLVEHCSAGECRALLLSLIFSQSYLVAVESGCVPILLLDEVCVYLDSERRGILFDMVCGYPGQCWLTAVDGGLFGGFGGDLGEVKIG